MLCIANQISCGSTSFSYPGSPFSLRTKESVSLTPTITIKQDNPNFTIKPDLPKGLSIQATTGEISGIPKEIIPLTDFKVSLSSASGNAETTLQIKIDVPNPCADSTISTGSGTIGDPYIICNPSQLQSIATFHITHINSNYKIIQDLDLSSISNFTPIGDLSTPFTGTIDGQGYTLFNLTMNHPGIQRIGLIGTSTSTVQARNINLVKPNVRGDSYVGVLGGHMQGYFENIHITQGTVYSNISYAGGVLGRISGSTSYIYDSSFEGTVQTPGDFAGGILGENFGGDRIVRSFVKATVSGNNYSGGLTGRSASSTTENCYFIGTVQGADYVGGLTGRSQLSADIVINSYAVAPVTATGTNKSGLVGAATSTQTNAYYNIDVAGQSDNDTRGIPRTTTQLQCPTVSSDGCAGVPMYAAWDDAVWDFGTSTQYPKLKWESSQ